MTECEYLENCPIFARFRLQGSKNYWIEMYCAGARQNQCARKVLRKQGIQPSLTLLPSGQDLDADIAPPANTSKAGV